MHSLITRRVARVAASALAVIGLVATMPGSPAQAKSSSDDERRLGTTRVAIAPAFDRALDRYNIDAYATNGADVIQYEGTVAVRFPIKDTDGLGAVIKHVGGIRFEGSGGNTLAFKAFTVRARKGTVAATVIKNGDDLGRQFAFNLKSSNRPRYGDFRMVLSVAGSRKLNQTFGANKFHPGQNLGFATIIPA